MVAPEGERREGGRAKRGAGIDAARLRAVSDAAIAVGSELDLERALQKVADAARELIGARYAALGIAKPDRSGLARFIVSGMPPDVVRAIGHWPRGLGLLGALLREPRPLRVASIRADLRSVGFPPNHPEMASFLGVPVRSGADILGNFYLADKLGAAEFSQEDEDLLVLFAAHAAVAVENARRFTETAAHLRRTLLAVQRAELRSRFLLELSALMPIGPIVEDLPFDEVAERATDLLGDVCAIFLLEPGYAWRVRTRTLRCRNPSRTEAASRLLGEVWTSLPGALGGCGEALFVADATAKYVTGSALDAEVMLRERFSAAMFVPVCQREQLYGLFVSLASQPATFADDDLAFGKIVAERLALAIENATLIRDLKSALQARDEFISIATHELKTPVTMLSGYAQILARGGENAEVRSKAVDTIRRQAQRLGNLTNELLDVARLRAGRLELQRERVDLVALCREALARFELLVGQQGKHQLRLSSSEERLEGEWDRGRVDQVLTNLISNAIKYSPQGGEVVVTVGRRGTEALVSVSDQGIGIPARERDRLFGTFERTSNAMALRIEGVGLGLHIAKEIVERHGGDIWFTSEEGKGSTFYFTLPLGENAAPAR